MNALRILGMITVLCAILFRIEVIEQAAGQTPLNEPGTERSVVPGPDSKIAWKFSGEDLRDFAPPMDITIAEMRAWANKLERPIPVDTSKWGGFQKYRERVALLKIDISKQIIAAKPDDDTLRSAWFDQWFPRYILAQQDRTKIPQFEELYTELKKQNDRHGRKFDRFTESIMASRGAVVRDLLKLTEREEDTIKKKYLTWGNEILAEYDSLLKDKPLGKFAEQFYSRKSNFLRDLSEHDEKYGKIASEFRMEICELLDKRESEVESATLYFSFGPLAPFDTPEGQAIQREWMARVTKRIAGMEDVRERAQLYRVKDTIFDNLLRQEGATEVEYFAYLEEMKEQSAKDEITKSYLDNSIYNGYFKLFAREFKRLSAGNVTDEALEHMFGSARLMLHAGESAYGHGGQSYWLFTQDGAKLFDALSLEQQLVYLKEFSDLIDETEVVEKEWKAAGKPMDSETIIPSLRLHLGLMQKAHLEQMQPRQ